MDSKWTDNVAESYNRPYPVCVQIVSQYVSNAPSNTANSTMHSKFALTVNKTNADATITANPTLCDEIGNYTFRTDQHIKDNPSSTATCSIVVQVVYPVKII